MNSIILLSVAASLLGTIFNITGAALGAGIVVFPFAFAQSGLVGSLLVLLFVLFAATLGNFAIVWSMDVFQVEEPSYQVT